jgi:predicted metalloprotease with PDZ domain
LLLVAVPLSAQSVRYDVSITDPAAHLFHVEAAFPAGNVDTLRVSLPAWSPGNYEIQNYARYVRHFAARDAAGHVLFWDRADKDTWRVVTGRSATVTVAFDYLADTIDLSIARLREDFGQFLGTNLFLFEEGRLDRPAEVRFALPAGWRVATALASAGGGVYTALDYHQLADAETFVGHFSLDSLEAGGHWIRLALWPVTDYTPPVAASLRASIAKIAPVQDQLMGGAPYDVYTVFFTVIHEPINFGGGLEHAASQYDIMPAGPDFADANGGLGSFINPLLAHEFFHLWNVKRIRPATMWPYDYHAEQYTPLLWWSEGVTDYYADLTNWRAGIWADSQFVGNVRENMRQVNSAPEAWSEEDGSLATWINEVYVNSSQLYYPKGSLTGLLLDISIRDATNNAHSLDEVMRALYTRDYKAGKGFTTADLVALLKEFGMPDADGFYRRYINGREPLPYAEVFRKAGLEMRSITAPYLGVSTDAGAVQVVDVAAGSAAQAAGVLIGDTLVSLGDVAARPGQDWGPTYRQHYEGKSGAPFDIVVRRGGRSVTLHATVRERSEAIGALSRVASPSAQQARIWRGLATGTTGS